MSSYAYRHIDSPIPPHIYSTFWENAIISLPESMSTLTNLIYLDLESNNIRMLPTAIEAMTNLQTL